MPHTPSSPTTARRSSVADIIYVLLLVTLMIFINTLQINDVIRLMPAFNDDNKKKRTKDRDHQQKAMNRMIIH